MKSCENAESDMVSVERMRMRIDNLEDENECLRDLLNDIASRLGLDPEDVHYYSQDNYFKCQTAVIDEMEKRLMMKGMRWPCFEDGEPVRFGDEFMTPYGTYGEVTYITFIGSSVCEHVPHCFYTVINSRGHDASIYYEGQRVMRPLVLAADDKPIEVGQTLYGKDGYAFEVVALHPGDAYDVEVDGEWHVNACGEKEPKRVKAEWLTHEKPVLDVDGVEIRAGDRVYKVGGDGIEFRVESVVMGCKEVCLEVGFGVNEYVKADQLTHKKPVLADTWERFGHDLFIELSDKSGYSEDVRKEAVAAFVDRAKKLAGVE